MPIPENCESLDLPLKTARLELRALGSGDLEDIHVLCSHPEICRFIRPPMTREQVVTHIEERLRPWHFEDAKWFSLAVTALQDPRVIGEIVFRMESRADRRAEIGYRFHPDAQGKGYALEAVRVLVEWLFSALDLHKLAAYCDAENFASKRLLDRLGMRQEGRRREQFLLNGAWRDLDVFGLLRREYRPTS